jgi:hydroxymethylpyrimidine/phosphomethylpyrimidine kinase
MKAALSIAGTDPSGGAGIHADLKTFAAHGVYGMAAVTAIVAQNTVGVTAIEKASPRILEAQLDAVFGDIFPDAVKIGMVPDAELIRITANALKKWKARNVVIDTVMASTGKKPLIDEGAETVLERELLPLALVITPNIPEAEVLCGFRIVTRDDMVLAAKTIARLTGAAILLKGGHLEGSCDDLLLEGDDFRWYSAPRIETRNTHGTGCTLSSAIASNLALGIPLPEAVARAKEYLSEAIRNAPGLGRGHGPVQHSR